jgi:hypothetical protein
MTDSTEHTEHTEHQQEAVPSEQENPLPLLDLETGPSQRIIWVISGIVIAVLGLWLIIAATFTDWPRRLLPYTDELAQLLVPAPQPGQEPLDLIELTHNFTEAQITVEGKVRNRTKQPLRDIIAIVSLGYLHLANPLAKTVPVEPSTLAPEGEGHFKLDCTLEGKLTGYSLSFKLANGAILRHSDQRNSSLSPDIPPR